MTTGARPPGRPPEWMSRVAAALLPDDGRELLVGDLEEAYAARGGRAAALVFVFEVLHASIAGRRRGSALPDLPRRKPAMIESLLRDLRYGLRGLARNRGFTAVAMISLALGIGFNTAIFTLVNAVLLRPLPVADPDRLLAIYSNEKDGYRYATALLLGHRDLRGVER